MQTCPRPSVHALLCMPRATSAARSKRCVSVSTSSRPRTSPRIRVCFKTDPCSATAACTVRRHATLLWGTPMTVVSPFWQLFATVPAPFVPFGRVPKWTKGPDCKSGGIAFEGSNPSSATGVHIERKIPMASHRIELNLVERSPLATDKRPLDN